MSEEGLDAVLNGTEGESAPVAEAALEEVSEAAEEVQPEVAEDVQDEAHTVPVAALQDERAKRQALEEQFQALQAQVEAQAAAFDKPAEPEQPLVPEGLDYFGEPDKALAAVAENLNERFQSQLNEMQMQNALQLSEAVARAKYDDFEQQVEAFRAEVRKDPTLVAQAQAHADPAEFIYRTGLRSAELAPFDGDLKKYREKVIADFTKEQEAKAAEAQRKKVPKSLTKDGAVAGSTPAGPKSLNEIFKR